MRDVLDLFDRVKNVQFTDFVDAAAEVPVFRLVELSARDWNKKAIIQNTKMFIEINKRIPQDYNEVVAWIKEEQEKSHIAGNDMAVNAI